MSDTTSLPAPEQPELQLDPETLASAPLIDEAESGNAQSLNELMEKDPLSYTDADVDQIVEIFRRQRHNFMQSEAEKTAEKKAKPKQPAPALPAGTKLTLAALGFTKPDAVASAEPPKPKLPPASALNKGKPLTLTQLLAASKPKAG